VAGSTVTKDVPNFALVIGIPARVMGWVSQSGKKLVLDKNGYANYEKSKKRYKINNEILTEINL